MSSLEESQLVEVKTDVEVEDVVETSPAIDWIDVTGTDVSSDL